MTELLAVLIVLNAVIVLICLPRVASGGGARPILYTKPPKPPNPPS